MSSEPLLQAGVRLAQQVVESRYEQREKSASTWKGRVVYQRVKNTLIASGVLGGLGTLYGATQPLSATYVPNWALGGLSLGFTLLVCASGCLIWRYIPQKKIENAILDLEANQEELENQKLRLSEENQKLIHVITHLETDLKNNQELNQQLLTELNKSKTDLGDFSAHLEVTLDSFSDQNERLEKNTDQLKQRLEEFKNPQHNLPSPSSTTTISTDKEVLNFNQFLEEDN